MILGILTVAFLGGSSSDFGIVHRSIWDKFHRCSCIGNLCSTATGPFFGHFKTHLPSTGARTPNQICQSSFIVSSCGNLKKNIKCWDYFLKKSEMKPINLAINIHPTKDQQCSLQGDPILRCRSEPRHPDHPAVFEAFCASAASVAFFS